MLENFIHIGNEILSPQPHVFCFQFFPIVSKHPLQTFLLFLLSSLPLFSSSSLSSSAFFIKTYCVLLELPICVWLLGFQWIMENLPVTTPSKKSHSPTSEAITCSSVQSRVSSPPKFMLPFCLIWSCTHFRVGGQSYSEVMSTMALSCPWDCKSQYLPGHWLFCSVCLICDIFSVLEWWRTETMSHLFLNCQSLTLATLTR